MSQVEPLVRAADLVVTFGRGPGAVKAVDGVSLSVAPGERVGVVGESGSGKTTVARVIAGLERASSGSMTFDTPLGRRGLRADVQMVFQDPYQSLNPRLTAQSAVGECLRVRQRLSRRDARDAAVALLASIGVGETLARRLPDALSGGQRQRVSVARALAAQPRLLIADEPTSALDQSAQAQLLNLMSTVQQERDLAVLFISHDLGIIRYFTDRVYVMRRGRVIETGPTESVFGDPQSDYTRMLIEAIPGRRSGRGPDLSTAGG